MTRNTRMRSVARSAGSALLLLALGSALAGCSHDGDAAANNKVAPPTSTARPDTPRTAPPPSNPGSSGAMGVAK